jgi:hypothetical protein
VIIAALLKAAGALPGIDQRSAHGTAAMILSGSAVQVKGFG